MSELRFFNPYADIRHTENRLPHWQQQGAVYFITFRLADSVPSRLRNQWEHERQTWLKVHPEPWSAEIEREYHRRFSGAIERWLDAGHGACLLRRRECGEIVAETLRHFEGERLIMISLVVMPNHVHALFVQNPEWPLEKLIRSWKGFSARKINSLLDRSGNFWQRDYFDRLVRDNEHFANCVRYIRRNPAKAQLTQNEFILWESDLARSIA
ncbi:MAG: REP-associated tyrosine transposase [Verrucomicrobiota bacterium]|jgi:REP element-mobilizing transposase RayT